MVAVCNIATSVFTFCVFSKKFIRMKTDLDSCTNHVDSVRSYCSNVVDFVQLMSVRESGSFSSGYVEKDFSDDVNEESEFDVVGIYGYGQTRSAKHIFIYRDDKLRNGQSKRVYIKKIPLSDVEKKSEKKSE